MPLDGLTLRCVTEEINRFAGASVQKIYQPEKDEAVLLLHTKEGAKKLLICASPESPRLQISDAKFKNPESAPMFCMLLRKHFTSARLKTVRQAGLDRTADIVFECRNELGDKADKHIIVEIMGRSSNIIVTDSEYKIYDCLRKNDLASLSERMLMPGFNYTFLSQPDKCDITRATKEEAAERAASTEGFRLARTFTGFSPLAEREAEKRGDAEKFVAEIIDAVNAKKFTPSVVFGDEKPVDFWCFYPYEYDGALKIKTYATMGEAMDDYYLEKDRAEHIKKRTSSLNKLVSNLVKRAEKKIRLQAKELADAEKKDEYKAMGDLITANLYKIKKGDKLAEVSDWSDGEEKILRIPIDENLSPSDNAQRCYKKYAKAKTAEIMITKQLAEAREELSYLESVLQSIEQAESEEDISQIREELADGGYISGTAKTKKGKIAKEKKAEPLAFEFEGFRIYVGRNNKQNDYLTLKLSRANDIWLHVKNNSGSHVIISSGGEKVPDNVIYHAAYLAAKHSKAQGAPKTEVDYTLVKNVKKPSGAKPGMVIYTDYRTCII